MGKDSRIPTGLYQLSPELKEKLTNISGSLGEINDVADQLAYAVTGSFDFTVQVESNEPTVQKLSIMVNFLLETIRRTISELETKNKSLTETTLTLQASEERFRSVVQSASDAIVLANGEGIIIAWNKSAQTIFDYTEQEVLGQPLSILMPERYREAHQRGLEKLTVTGRPTLIGKTLELYGLTKDGREFPLELTLSTWQTGQDKFYSGVIHDISERKQAEKEWARLVNILESTSDCVATADATGQLLYLNQAGRKMLEVNELEDITETTIPDYYPTHVAPFIMNEALPVAEREGVWTGETLLRAHSGREIPVSQVIMAHKDKDGKIDFYSSIVRDITERKQAEETLRQNEERFRQVVSSINAHVYVTELPSTGPAINRYISPNVEALTGYPLERFLSDWSFWPSVLIHPEDREIAASQVANFAHTDYSEVEYRLTRADGQVIWVHDSGHIHRDSLTNNLLVYGFVTDVSERKEAEATLEKSYSVLNATFESIADGVVVVDLAGQTVAFNQRFVQMWNIPEEIIKNTRERIDFIAKQLKTSDKFQQRQQELTQQPDADGYDILELNDGRIFERHAKPQWLGDKIVGRVWNFRDITEQKRVEESLRQNEASMATAQRIVHMGNWETYIPTGYLYWSDEIYRIFGLEPKEFSATVEAFFATVHPDDLAYVLKAVDDAMAGRRGYNVDHRIIRPDGEIRFVHQEAEVTFDEAGQPLRMLGIVQDVTDRRQLEEQIQGLLERRSRQVQLSTQVAQEVALATNLDDLYRRVVTGINEQFGFYHTQLLRYYPDTEKLILKADYGAAGQQMVAEGQQVGLNEGLSGLATLSGTAILKSDISTDLHWRGQSHLPDTRGELAVPITVGSENPQIQVTAIQHFINSDLDGFAVIALDPLAVAPLAHKSIRGGKPVVAISTDLGEQNQTALVSSSEQEMGYLLGQQAAKWAKKHTPKGKPAKIGLLVYAEPFGEIVQREAAIIKGFGDKFGPNFSVIRKEAEGSVAEGMIEWLKLQPDMNIVIGSTDALALGAYQAVIALEKNDPDAFFIGGVDAIVEAVRAVKSGGAYQATVTQSPYQIGALAVHTLVAAIKGLPYEQVKPIDHILVTSANVAEFLNKDGQMLEVEITPDAALTGLDLSQIKIGFAVLNLTNPFFVAMVGSARAEAERLGVQLVVNDPKRVLGVLNVQSNIAGSLNIEDQLVLEGLCGQIAIAIESTRLRQEMEERLHELNALQRLMSVEGWQAFQATRQQTTQAYLFDQIAVQATTVDELLQQQESNKQALTNATNGSNGHILAKPITVRGEIIGGLGIQNEADDPLSLEDQVFLDAITEQVAEALERARLLEQSQKRAAEMETVAQVGSVASTILDTDKLLQEVADLTKERFGLYHAQVYLLNEAGDTLNLVAGSTEVGRQMKAQGWNIPMEQNSSLVAQAARTRQTVIVSDVRQSPDFLANPLLPETRSEMAVPLIVGSTILGVLDAQSEIISRFTAEDIQIQTTLAAQVAIAVQNARSFEQAQVALVENQQQRRTLQVILDNMPLGVYVVNAQDGSPLLVNQTGIAMVQGQDSDPSAQEQPQAYQIYRVGTETPIIPEEQPIAQVMAGAELAHDEEDFIRADGSRITMDITAVPIRDEAGQMMSVLSLFQDITERKQAEEETKVLYKTSNQLTRATNREELLEAVSDYARSLGAVSGSVLYVDNDPQGQPEWVETVADWSTLGAPSTLGERYYLPEFPFAKLWVANPEAVTLIDDAITSELVDPATRAIFSALGTHGQALLPLTVQKRWVGLVSFGWDRVYEFSERDNRLFTALSRQASTVVDSLRLGEQMQKRATELKTVTEVGTAASTNLEQEQLLQVVVDLTKERFKLYHAHVYLLNEIGDTLLLTVGAGEVGRKMVEQGWRIPVSKEQSLVATAVRTRKGVIANDVRQVPDFLPNPLLPETRSEMAVPLIVGNAVLGVLDVQSNLTNRFTEDDLQIQTTLAAQVAVALRNASLYQQTQAALTDFKQSQELLRTTIDATPDWIFIKDRDHRFRLVNKGHADSLYTTPDDIIGKTDLDLGFPEDIVKGNPALGIRGFWQDDDEVMASGKSKIIDVEPAFVDGRPIFLSTIKVPLRDSTGNVWGVLGFVRDITQREQLLAEAEGLYKASRRVNEAKDLQGIVAAVAEARPLSTINRVVFFSFERNSVDQVEAMVVMANWYSGQGTPPSPLGRRYDRDGFASVELMLSPDPLFFNDVQHDDRMDAAIVAVTQQQNIRAMVVLPLQVGGRELGVLILQSEEVHEFTGREVQFYLSLAPQIAVAIDNQRLLAETRAALAEVEQTQRRYTVQVWEEYRNKRSTLSLEHVREGVTPLGDELLPEITLALAQSRRPRTNSDIQVIQSEPATESSKQHTQTDSSLLFPLTVRGETIGILGLQELDDRRVWSPEEISLVEAICEQLVQAAENIRLIDETQQRAAREKRVNEIGEKIQAAQSLEEALKIAVKEVGLSLQTSQTTVKLGSQ